MSAKKLKKQTYTKSLASGRFKILNPIWTPNQGQELVPNMGPRIGVSTD